VGAWTRAAVAVVLGAGLPSCFSGADALGLPCRGDADCGQGQRCEQGFCGGPPAASAETSDPSSSSSSSSSAESDTGVDSSTSGSTGPLPSCGNGVLDPEEECDPGPAGDAPDCDADCTAVVCGDGHANLAAGEQCDDANDALVDACTPQCRATLFWDDMEGGHPVDGGKWLPPEIPVHQWNGQPFSLAAGWQWPSPVNPGTWYSGPYSADSGTARLVTQEISFPDPGPGFHYELVMYHRLRFDGNVQDAVPGVCPASANDGGVVHVTDGASLIQVAPIPGHPTPLTNTGLCSALPPPNDAPDNPLLDPLRPRSVYSGITPNDDFVHAFVPLPSSVVGQTLRLVFEIGYDCDNCWTTPPLGAGWTIEWVVVAPMPN
jgi:cysteine-rich repeat protein